MPKLVWDATSEREFETGVDHGVLYPISSLGTYPTGYAWNGLTTVTESPSGAESNPQYADNIKYLNLISAEEFGGTIEAFTYPDEFGQCDGTAEPVEGIQLGQQNRKKFGMSYRTKKGNDVDGQDAGYKIHLVYGAQAAPSEKAYATVNDSPEAITFSWEFTTDPISVEGYKPTATLVIDSTKVDPDVLSQIEDILYGSGATNARLPLPAEILQLAGGDAIEVTPTAPTASGNNITIPDVTGVVYSVAGTPVTGTYVMTADTTVIAAPAPGYAFTSGAMASWNFTYV